MNNQLDPAVEAALKKAEKLLSREPQLRRKLYLKLIEYAAIMAIAIFALIALNQCLQHIFKSRIDLFFAGMSGFNIGLMIWGNIALLAQVSKKSIGPKLMVAIRNEFCDFDVPEEYIHQLFDKKEINTLLRFKKQWAWLKVNFYITLPCLVLLVGVVIYGAVSLPINWLEINSEMGQPLEGYQIIIVILAGAFLGLLAAISFAKTFIILLSLFSPKTYWLTSYASLLGKIRIIKTEYAKWKTDEDASAELAIADQ